MARVPSLGVVKLLFVPTIVNIAAPTVAEINVGSEQSGYLLRGGLDTPQKGKTIPAASVLDLYDTTVPGSYGGDPISAVFFRDNVAGTDTAWATHPPRTVGFWVVARFGGTGAPASAQKNLNALANGDRVEVWPITVIARAMDKISESAPQTFTVHCAVPKSPNVDAIVN